MKSLPQILFWVGVLSIPLSWLVWFMGPEIEVGRAVLSNITDPALKAVLREAHAERLGIFVGLWAPSMLMLSYILEKKNTSGK
jgi:hypothetical protein